MNRFHTSIAAAALAISGALAVSARAAEPVADPSAVPAEAFFGPQDMSEPVLSPDGSGLAILMRNKQGHRALVVLDTQDLTKVTVAAAFADADVAEAQWVNNKRLIFYSWQEEASLATQQEGDLFAVDRDGSDMRTLIRGHWGSGISAASHIKTRTLDPSHRLLRTLENGGDEILVEHASFSNVSGAGARTHETLQGTAPLRLDTRSGITRSVFEAHLPDNIHSWIFDGQGKLIAARAQDAGQSILYTLDGTAWKERARFAAYASDPNAFEVWDSAPDGRIFVKRTTPTAARTDGLYVLDPATFKPEAEPTISLKGFDFDGELVEDLSHRKLLGLHYQADGAGTVWFDPAMKDLQAKIDARLPGLINTIDPAVCGCSDRVLVTAHSARQPPIFVLYDRKDDTLITVGKSRTAIDPRQMASTDFVRIQARDGKEIPVWVTKPHGKGPWPAVVLVHGGPMVRGWHWRWDPESQFLASRGYLVVKPEYRGSEGYGATLFESGFKQWGLGSQDDIADATRWAAAQGLADASRTCIAGASYGGYATLMGLVRYGDLYRCGIAWAAVADIGMMYDIWWSDFSDEWKGYGMPVQVGDPVQDKDQFDATSPLKQAARIKRPLLLAHGSFDRRVPIEHANALRDALESQHAPLTWVLYKDEGHGWASPENRADWYRRMEAFLAANDGPLPAKP